MAWHYVLEDLAGVARGELAGATDKTVTPLPVNTLATAGFKVPLDHPDADFLLGGDALLAVYESDVPGYSDQQLRAHLRLVTAEEVADESGKAGVATTWADGLWVLLRRLAGKSKLGYNRGTALAPVDRGTIIADLVNATNAESPSGTVMGNVQASSTTYAQGWYYRKVAECIAELSATLDGPDYQVRPTPYTNPGAVGGSYGALDVYTALGATRLDTAFEYGDGLLNVKSYQRAVSMDTTANRVFHLPAGFPDTTAAVLSAQDAASIAARGLLEDIVAADLSVDDLRTKLLAHHIAVRKGPRQVITFEPVRDLGGRVPRFGVDWLPGDVVPFRASYLARDGRLVKRIDALVRIYAATFAVDDVGVATPTLTVTPS